MYYTYVLLSLRDKEFYIGYTNDVSKRFKDHAYGKTPSTIARRPFELIYYEAHLSKKDALRRESYFKSTKGRVTFKQPVDPMLIADKNKRDDWIKNKNMRAFNFYKGLDTYEEVDIVIDSPVSFEEVYKDALDVSEKGLRFKVISPKYFVKMKKSSGRDKDLDDIKKLKMVRKDI
ncbi:MAG: hypothetical protein A3I73_02845 [Omnitrophica bacterium RIFCSPLOWO2_02_FULL_45_16]|nr:MAG: hypothetical protein A3C51_03880 [Omnitrophica bacterium RIFCSPHIGHO2_02_FULL_46_20]OGW93823.1 MAG: hypothetical protein A3G36_04915 [Omnitrophica bacterium RIFCSPLOWO2_12_FULL_45_13]OGW94635.1 MAG: hypothetical protein A3K16_05405 [Omnitrophica bacterium RIFCSPLOWO2_01_FULL_45_24]OGX00626.1 MAG: hypothetical protein A3I73_02845 [Omnitrophica bacterium RIFCSPLOWO2_02_FULL_45_16]